MECVFELPLADIVIPEWCDLYEYDIIGEYASSFKIINRKLYLIENLSPGIYTIQVRIKDKLLRFEPHIEQYTLHIEYCFLDSILYSFGSNISGQLGLGDQIHRYLPTKVNINTKQLSAGFSYSLIIDNDNNLLSCGYNGYGSLGLDHTDDVAEFTKVGTSKWKFIRAGSFNTFAIKDDDTLWSCGYNEYGTLGLGDFIDYSSLRQVGLDTWKYIDSLYQTTIGIKFDGTLWIWGSYNNSNIPVQIGNDTNWQICKVSGSIGQNNFLAIKEDGSLYTWGINTTGALGHGHSNVILSPALVDGSKWKNATFDFSGSTLFLINIDSTLWYCGISANILSSLDNNPGWSIISAGNSFIGIKNNKLYGFGLNGFGELGSGDTEPIPSLIELDNRYWSNISTSYHTLGTIEE